MKKIVLTTLGLVMGAAFAHSQGLVSLSSTTKGTIITNGSSISQGTGNAGGVNNFQYELLDITAANYAALTTPQSTGIASLLGTGNGQYVSLWTDSGLNGASGSLNNGGESTALAGGQTAVNWAAPGAAYATSDYYAIVGWSSNEGTSWLSISNSIATGSWAVTGVGSWFGESVVAFNSAGGGVNNLAVVNAWLGQGQTGIAGSGMNAGNPTLTLTPIVVPEPTTLALAGLGGISMLFLRRRKA